MTKGRVTLPAQEGMDEEIKNIVKRWGADAVRDSDGTKIPEVIKQEADKVYSKYFFTRGDQDYAKANLDERQHMFIMSEPVTATEEDITIPILAGYFKEQLKPDTDNDPKRWWQVINRTTGEVVPTDQWEYLEETEEVKVCNVELWHRYTVNVLMYQIWDPVHMYNHITNDWTTEHQMPYDPRYPKTRQYILERLRTWLDEHPDTDVVRITTFFYNFTLVFNDVREEKYVDWFGYGATVSPRALEAFENEKGYKLTAEDFVDQGYYNSPFRMPKKAFLDWIDFQSKFVSELAKECVDIIHAYGKEAMMFLGDHWAGTEPYGKYFKNIGLDAVVGSVGDGTTLRMIADIPHVDYHEGRFLPYFFPDTFNEHNNPVVELNQNWLQSRRAILRKPIQRMGYGGYLSLALDFPDFVDRVEEITDEFREMHDHVKEAEPFVAPFKVAILNSWGSQRKWMSHHVHHAIWYKQCYSYYGILEALSGLPFEVEFISFEDIKTQGISDDIGVIINAGEAHTSWVGDDYWKDAEVVEKIRAFVQCGGGFIGVGEPTSFEHQGAFFQLPDVLGVQKEMGFSLSKDKYNDQATSDHFILADQNGTIDYGESTRYVYQASKTATVLDSEADDIKLATNTFGDGRAAYLAGLPYSPENARLLKRTLYWAASKEAVFHEWHTTNIYTECAAYPEAGTFVVINNTHEEQVTNVYKPNGTVIDVTLAPMNYQWFEI